MKELVQSVYIKKWDIKMKITKKDIHKMIGEELESIIKSLKIYKKD